MNKCTICLSENVQAIDDCLDSGTSQKDVAQQFSVSRFAVSRHVKHSAPVPENADAESLEVQAQKWLQRADDIYAQSSANGDIRGQTQSLAVAFRGLELQQKSEKAAAEAAPVAGETVLTIEAMDRIISKELDATPRGKNQNRLYSAPDEVLELAAKIADNPNAWHAVRNILESTRVN